ncbi:uncharacterized protein LOC110730018 [Chenopodium quinoa]|uniref:uncharacterized protein LOC110730018 n=1 Tax=Chenopodium quinoa TaxID=63459 RepID=UPI000B76ECED|nr:uncharacterized protein LOC110730018 [Chenopodium quinoa]
MEEQVKQLEKKIEEQASNMQALMQMVRELKEGGGSNMDSQRNSNGGTLNRPQGMVPKIQFPTFDGSNPRIWIKKCSRYFSLCKIANEVRVDLASLYMIDKAESWVSSYLSVRKNVDWDDFIIDVTPRFKDGKGINVVEQFNKLQQDDNLEDYIDKFEDLRSVLLQNGHCLSEEYILECFVGGLKFAIKPFVRAFNPSSITEAVGYARLQEEQLVAYSSKPAAKPFQNYQNTKQYTPNTYKPPLLPTPHTKPTSQVLTKFQPRPFKHIPADEYSDECDEDSLICDSEPRISMNALSGNQSFHTMRVVGMMNGKPLHIVIDSGSTHNFLDLTLATKLGCQVEKISPQSVTVADGNHIACQHKCSKFEWVMNKRNFEAEVMLISLGGCDMVLGVQWLRIPPKKVQVVDGKPDAKVLANAAHLCLLQVVDMDIGSLESECILSSNELDCSSVSELQDLKDQFSDIFADPAELPPLRGVFDHKIPLVPNASLVNIRPYRYPLKQRDVIEQLIQEMVDRGIVQNSSSPFASPVVLVGKKDGTWVLCVDYRELNKRTVKDKFPIPVVE